jgi:hypothetical protein
MSPYPPITDWSKQGRTALVAAHRARMAALLEFSLGRLARHYGEERLLRAFHFDTMGDAIDFCLERFAQGELDPERLPPESRSFRLFTEARFWLAQRASFRGYAAIMSRLEQQTETDPGIAPLVQEEEPSENLDVKRLVVRLVATLRQFRERTCPDLVGWWLHATDTMRAGWFDAPVTPPEHIPESKKSRSKLAHDAAFRFQCLHRALIQEDGVELPHRVVGEWLFRRCANVPPYRRSEAEVAAALPPDAPKGKRAIWELRRRGVAALLDALLDVARCPPSREESVALLEWQLLRHSLEKTTLLAFELDEGKARDLERRMSALPGIGTSEEP